MARGGYTPSQIREMTDEEIHFVNHYQTLNQRSVIEQIGRLLGVIWDIDEVKNNSKKESDEINSDRLITPLSMVINPQIMDVIKKQKSVKETSRYIGAGEYIAKSNEKIVSMGDLSKEEFYKMIGKPMPSQTEQGARSPLGKFGQQP